MDLKDLLLLLDAGSPCGARLALAVAVARRHGAALTGLCLYGEPVPTIAECYAIGPEAARAIIDRRDAEVALAVEPVATRFREALKGANVEISWASSSFDQSSTDLPLRARAFDLVIVGGDPRARDLTEQIVLSGGAPCLAVREGPRCFRPFDRVLVAWDGSRPARRALQDSLPFLKQAKAVRLVTVRRGRLDLPPHLGQAEILRHLRRHGVEATFEQVDPGRMDIGSALLRDAGLFEADLLVLGAYGHAPTAELLFGGATRTVLARAEPPVLISH